MPAPLPVPIEFRLPEGWLPAQPNAGAADEGAFAAVHPHPDAGFAANITIDGTIPTAADTLTDLADESVERLRHIADSVEVTHRREVGPADSPALTQHAALTASVDDARRDLIQSQVYLGLQDVADPHKRAVIQPTLTSTAAQHELGLAELQEFVRTVHPASGAGA